ncbi:LysM peptidoglycan-binding domain-containing protein [Paenibacillus sp. CMAA1364]
MLRYSTYKSIHTTINTRESYTYMMGIRMKEFVVRPIAKKSLWVLLLIIVGCSVSIQSFANSAPEPHITKNRIIQSGDTLWGIAVQEKPADMDTRIFIKEMKKLNGLTDGQILAGEVLKLPTY